MNKQSDYPASPSALVERAGQDTRAVDFAVSLFAAMAHPTRLKMVELLTEREYTVNGMAEALGLLQSNASQHLTILSRAGIVKATRAGAAHRYGLRGPRITDILRLVAEFRAAHAAALRGEATRDE